MIINSPNCHLLLLNSTGRSVLTFISRKRSKPCFYLREINESNIWQLFRILLNLIIFTFRTWIVMKQWCLWERNSSLKHIQLLPWFHLAHRNMKQWKIDTCRETVGFFYYYYYKNVRTMCLFPNFVIFLLQCKFIQKTTVVVLSCYMHHITDFEKFLKVSQMWEAQLWWLFSNFTTLHTLYIHENISV